MRVNKIFNRNTYVGMTGAFVFILCLWIRLAPSMISNFSAIMGDTISFASFITCLMFISLAYLPLQSNSKFVHAMQD